MNVELPYIICTLLRICSSLTDHLVQWKEMFQMFLHSQMQFCRSHEKLP